MKTAILMAAGALVAATGAQAQSTVYSNNFTTVTGTGTLTGTGVAAVTPSGEHYLELANGNAATFTLPTATYTGLSISFDLYGVESVDGNGPYGGGADPFLIYLNGSATPLYNLNIANFDGDTQSFNGDLSAIGAAAYAPRTGAAANNTLGYGTGGFGDSTYHLAFALPNSAVTSITFVGQTNESAVDPNGSTAGNEAYGIDNLAITGMALPSSPMGAVPEPASWAMMIAGFGMVGAGLRGRRRQPVARYI